MAVISTIEGERNHILRHGGEIRGHFPSASTVKKSTEKEGATSGESDSGFPCLSWTNVWQCLTQPEGCDSAQAITPGTTRVSRSVFKNTGARWEGRGVVL